MGEKDLVARYLAGQCSHGFFKETRIYRNTAEDRYEVYEGFCPHGIEGTLCCQSSDLGEALKAAGLDIGKHPLAN